MGEGAHDVTIPRGFWILAGVAAALVVCGLLLWYAQHPDRSPFVDFAGGPHPPSNGLGPASAPEAGPDAVAATDGGADGEGTGAY